MTNEEILEKQVEALEKLLQLKQAIVEELEAKVSRLEIERINFPPLRPHINLPSCWPADPCTDGLHHEYPFPWHSTTPAPCKKCGKQSTPNFTVTSTVSSTDINLDPHKPTTLTTIAKK
jgi:hypothetical protein